MAKNQKHITIASINYLNEISAIPQEVRGKYLNNLLDRKNSNEQKNVMLLKIIYGFAEEEKFSEWNTDNICKKLNMDRRAFYLHKSRLHKGLREYYFNWKAKEREVEKTHEDKAAADSVKDDNHIKLNMEKARKMWEIGMKREAIGIYKNLATAQRNLSINEVGKYLNLFEIYEYHAIYYTTLRKKPLVSYYIKKLKDLSGSIKSLKLDISEEELALLAVRLDYRSYSLSLIKWNSNRNNKLKNSCLENIYLLSKKFNFNDHLLRVLYSRATNEINKDNFDRAKEFCMEGYNTAKTLKNEIVMHTFASFLYYLKTKYKVTNVKLNNDKILEYYYHAKKASPLHLWTGFLENAIVLSYYPEKRKEVLEIYHQLINSNILKGDFSFAVYTKFKLKEETFYNNIFFHFKKSADYENYIEIDNVDKKYLDDIEKTCFNTLCYQKELNNQAFIWDVYKLQLTAKFFNEDSFDYDSAMLIVKKMEWLKKEKKNMKRITSVSIFELLKIGLKMLEHSDNEKYMLDKYEYRLIKAIDNLKKNPSELNIMDYAIVSSLAGRLKCKSITNIAAEFYEWLEKHHAEILAPAFRQIEERKSKVYTVAGSGTAA